MNKYRPSLKLSSLTLIGALSLSILATGAQACMYYRDTIATTKIWGLPEEDTSSVQAILPAKARVCVEEQLPAPNAQTWARISSYVIDDIRYRARGWVNLARLKKSANPTNPAGAALTNPDTAREPAQPGNLDQPGSLDQPKQPKLPATSPVDRSDPDDAAMIDTLQAQQRELEELKNRNAELQKRLKATPKTQQETGKKKLSAVTTLKNLGPTSDPMFLKKSWRLNPSLSKLRVESVTDTSLVENHRFEQLTGEISADGKARIDIPLNKIKTGNKMRDVRLSHLLFQSDKYPSATISASLDMKQFTQLANEGRQTIDLKIDLKLHGMEKQLKTKVKLKRMTDGRIGVASVNPVMISAADFRLTKGIAKLVEVAGLKRIIPVVPVRFNLVFDAQP